MRREGERGGEREREREREKEREREIHGVDSQPNKNVKNIKRKKAYAGQEGKKYNLNFP